MVLKPFEKVNKFKTTLVMVAGIGLITASQALGIVNAGFETGDFTGWTVNGPADVATSHVAFNDPRIYAPAEGNYFARLVAGLGANTYTTISQSFHLNAGETISGVAAFDAGDELPDYNDDAFLKIQSDSGTTVLWSANVARVGNNDSTPWESWAFIAPTSDTYVLTFGVANQFDNSLNSLALLDMGGSVELPDGGGMVSILGMSLLGLLGLRRFSLRFE
jgi:hypothetical protein